MTVEEPAHVPELVAHAHRTDLTERVAQEHLGRCAGWRRTEALVHTNGRRNQRGRQVGGLLTEWALQVRPHPVAHGNAEVGVDLESADAVLELPRHRPAL